MRYLLFCLLLSGCVGTCEPLIVREPFEVLVPVVTKCKIEYPEKPADLGKEPTPDGFYGKGIRIMQENVDYRMYSKRLEAALMACADDKRE